MNDKQPIISENESINNIDTSTSINEISNGTFDYLDNKRWDYYEFS